MVTVFYFLGDRVDRVLSPVYGPLGRGKLSCLLVTLLDSESNGVRVEFPRVVCECLDVFFQRSY